MVGGRSVGLSIASRSSSDESEYESDSESECSDEDEVPDASDGCHSCFKGDEVRRFLAFGVGVSSSGAFFRVFGVVGLLWAGGGGGASSQVGVDGCCFFKIPDSGRMESLKGVLGFSGVAGELVLRTFGT